MKSHSIRHSPTYFQDIYNALKLVKPWGRRKSPLLQEVQRPEESPRQRKVSGKNTQWVTVDTGLTSFHSGDTAAQFDNAASSDSAERKTSPESREWSLEKKPATLTQELDNDARKASRQKAWMSPGESTANHLAQAHLTQVFQRGQSGIAMLKERLERIKSLQQEVECAHSEIAQLKSKLDDLYRPHLKVKVKPETTPLQKQREIAADRIAELYREIQNEGHAFMVEVERFNNSLAAQAGTRGADPAISPTLGRFKADSQVLVQECEGIRDTAFTLAKRAADHAPHTRLSRLVESAADTPDKRETRSDLPKEGHTPATTPRPETPEVDLSESLVEDNATDMAEDFRTMMGIDSQTAKTCLAQMNHIVQAMAPHAQQLRDIEAHIQTWLQSNPDGVRSDAEAHYATYKVESEREIQKGQQLLGRLHCELLAIVSRGTDLFQHNDVRNDIGNARQHARTHHAHLNEVLTQANELMTRAGR